MKCKLPDGTEHTIRPLDEGRLALAGLLAMNSGGPVTFALSDGSTVGPVRIGEIEHLATQLVAPK